MASDKTLNAKNLAALGAERLADLLLELAGGDAAAKRRLRLELASQSGGDDVVAEIRKRLVTIAKAKSFVEWHKVRALAKDLEAQRAAIMKHVAPTRPIDALDLLWRLLEAAPSLYERCDDSNGTIGDIMDEALDNVGEVAPAAKLAPDKLADRVFVAVCANDYAQFDGLIGVTAEALGQAGLGLLKSKFEALSSARPARAQGQDRRVIAISSRGPMYEDDYADAHHARTVRSALTQIADALGDVDGYAARFSESEQGNPAIAADIAARLLAAGRAPEAMAALSKAAPETANGRRWPDWAQVRIDTFEALGRTAEAQDERWAIFERDLSADYLKAYLKRLPDFDDEVAETRALAYARRYAGFQQALAFLINWQAHDMAAELILERHRELDGDHYWLLTPAAEALDQRDPLAATLVLRAMIDFSLDKARSKRYGHAARHLRTCDYLSKRIENYAGHSDHETYLASLKLRHGRKAAFWNV